MAVQIQLRRGTTAEWALADPVLGIGEPGLELTGDVEDPILMKVGDGVTEWSLLPYVPITGPTGDTGPTGPQGDPGPQADIVYHDGVDWDGDAVSGQRQFYVSDIDPEDPTDGVATPADLEDGSIWFQPDGA